MDESAYERLQNQINGLEQELRNARNEIADLETNLLRLAQTVADLEHKVSYG
jgi:phage shock protein A